MCVAFYRYYFAGLLVKNHAAVLIDAVITAHCFLQVVLELRFFFYRHLFLNMRWIIIFLLVILGFVLETSQINLIFTDPEHRNRYILSSIICFLFLSFIALLVYWSYFSNKNPIKRIVNNPKFIAAVLAICSMFLGISLICYGVQIITTGQLVESDYGTIHTSKQRTGAAAINIIYHLFGPSGTGILFIVMAVLPMWYGIRFAIGLLTFRTPARKP